MSFQNGAVLEAAALSFTCQERNPSPSEARPRPKSPPTPVQRGSWPHTQVISVGVNSGPWACRPVLTAMRARVAKTALKPTNSPVRVIPVSQNQWGRTRPRPQRWLRCAAASTQLPTANITVWAKSPSKLIHKAKYPANMTVNKRSPGILSGICISFDVTVQLRS